VAGGCRGHLVVAPWGRGDGCNHASQHAVGRDRVVSSAGAGAPGDSPAVGARVAPGWGGAVGRAAAAGAPAAGPLCPRTVARGARVGGRGL